MAEPAPARRLLVVAIGGNALLQEGDSGTIVEQQERAREILHHVADLATTDTDLVLTHGNGPIVGNIVLRNEAARDTVMPMPLYIDDYNFGQALAFKKGSPLKDEFNKVQNEMKKDGTLLKIHQKWFGADPPKDSSVTNIIAPYMPNEKPKM